MLDFIERTVDSGVLYRCNQAYCRGSLDPLKVSKECKCTVGEAKLSKLWFNAYDAVYPAFLASNPLEMIRKTFNS